MENKLYRSKKDRVIGGVCAGLGFYFKVDPVWMRLIFICTFFFLAAFPLLLYIVLWIALPVKEEEAAVVTAKTGDAQSASAQPANNSGKVIISVIFAVALILAGVMFLFPNSSLLFKDIVQICVSLFLFAAAAKLIYEIAAQKNYSLLLTSMTTVMITVGVFLFLNSIRVLGYGALGTYAKYLFPMALIIGGVALVISSIKTDSDIPKIIGSSTVVLLLIALAIFSVVKNREDKTFRLIDRLSCPFFSGDWGKNWFTNVGGFGEADVGITLPANTSSVVYEIENRAGALKVISGNEMSYHYAGAAPYFSTNFSGGVFALKFDNKASDTTLKIPEGYPAEANFIMNAGELKADIRDMNVRDASFIVHAGNGELVAGDSIRTLDIELTAGNLDVEIPEDMDIAVTVNSTFGHIDMPRSFEFRDGAYRYDGEGNNLVEVRVRLTAGNVKFDLR